MDQATLVVTILDIFIGIVIWFVCIICMVFIFQSDLPEDAYTTIRDKIITPALKMIKSGVNRFVTSFNKFR